MQSKSWFPLLAAAFLAGALTASAQRGSEWRAYKAADGLPETFSTAVSIGPHGNIWVRLPNVAWIGRLDGYDVKAIPSPGQGTSRIYESPSGQIWTCTTDGLELYQDTGRGWTHYAVSEISAALHNTTPGLFWPVELCPLKQNQVLILVPEGLLQFSADDQAHSQTVMLRAANKTGLGKFSGMCVARDGGLWLAGDKGLARLTVPIRSLTPETPWQEFPAPASLQIRNLHRPVEDNAGGVTVVAESTKDGRQVIAHFDGQQWTIEGRTAEKIILAWRDNDASFWMATLNSLGKFRQGKSLAETNEETPRRNFDVAVDTNGAFWLATSEGLLRHAPLTWQSPVGAGTSSSAIRSVAEDESGRLWVYGANALHMLQNETWTSFPLPAEAVGKSLEARSLFALPNGAVVLQTEPGLLQFDPQSLTFSPITNRSQTRLKPLGLLKNGALCVQAESESDQPAPIEVFDGTNFSPFPYPLPETVTSQDFRFLFAAPGGGISLIGDQGIVWYHDKKWQSIASFTSISAEPPNCILETGNGKIWCGVQDSIREFDGQAWTLIRSGFYRVNSMLKARDGSIWVASDNGLHRFYRGGWSANGSEEGLPSPEVRDIYEDSRGQIWAATSRGLSLYHPEADPDPPQTEVQNLPGPNNTVREGATVTIGFNAQDKWKYTPADRLLFSYRLDGQEWSPYQEQRTVTFLELAAGKHTFHVRSMDRNWNVDPQPSLFEFAITLPWYRETRLLLISFVGLGLAVFFAGLAFNRHLRLMRSHAEVEAKVTLRTQQLELANRELFHSQKMNALGSLAAGIAHDFNNILSIIKGSAQIIEDNLDNTDKIRTRTDRIKTVVEQGAGIVNAMLGFSRTSDWQLALCDVNSVVQETITLLGDRFLREVEVQFMPAPTPLPPVPASKDFIQQILLNFIFNAAEAMTERRQVILSAVQSNHLPTILALKPAPAGTYIFISVKDFGAGIRPELMPRIFEPFFTTKSLSVRRGTGLGLSMAYELARQMDCGLAVESTPGQGSVFMLIIPVRDLPVETPAKSG